MNPKSEYLLLLRGNSFKETLSPQDLQDAMGRFAEWFERLKRDGKLKAGQPLGDGGKVISGKDRAVADGPFAEAKEAVAGYIMLAVDDEAEAMAIAAAMPIAGAPRMASSRIAAHTSATVVQRRSTRSPGSRVWSSSTTASRSSRITSAGASTRAARSGAGDDQVPSSQLVR